MISLNTANHMPRALKKVLLNFAAVSERHVDSLLYVMAEVEKGIALNSVVTAQTETGCSRARYDG